MAKLNWKDITTRVANRCGIEQMTPYQKSSILGHIKDTLIKIHVVSEDNTKRSTRYAIFDGLPISTAPTVESTAAPLEAPSGLNPGIYRYAFAYYNSIQGESELVQSAQVEFFGVADEQIHITGIPVRPHGVDSIKVYRSKVDETTTFYLHSTLSNDATSFYDRTADTSLGAVYTTPTKYANESNITFPDDYLALRQVIFEDVDGNQLLAIEAYSEEQFQKYSPSDVASEGTIREVMAGSLPYDTDIREERIPNSSAIFYTVQDTLPITFNYKNRQAGYLTWLYVAIPDADFAIMTASPDIMYAYYDTIIEGASFRYLQTKLLTVTNEAQLQAMTVLIRVAKSEYEASLKKYTGLVKRTAEVQILQIPSFLNDPTMDIDG